jgi:outer membrane lipoprotein-sorting protein
MKKILTSLLLSSSLLIPSLALAQAQPTRGLFGWFPAPKRVAAAPSATEVMAGVQKFYAGVTTVKAKFRQEVTNATFGRTDVSDGMLLIKKPGNMRWQYFSKKKKGKAVVVAKDFISNGSYLFVIDYENKQIIKKDLKKNLLPTAITFLYGKGDLAADFTPELDTTAKYGGSSDFVLKLVPKASSAQYKTLHLVVDPGNFRVKESIIVDGSGNKNHFRFYAPAFDAPIEDTVFQFSEKSPKVKAFRIIDGDQEADKQNAPPSAPTTPAVPVQ